MPLIMDNEALFKACSIDKWYEDFQDVTIQTNIVRLPKNVLNYLRDDVMILPSECHRTGDLDDWGDDEDDLDDQLEFTFPEFSEIVVKNLRAFCRRSPGCFIKTNWHAPIDAKWINTGQSLCVKQLDEFYQVLKASDIVREDLNRYNTDADDEGGGCVEHNSSAGEMTAYVIAFREYQSHIHPGSEFRCYVKHRELIGITSRWHPEFFSHFVTEKTVILNDIQTFFTDHIRDQFPLDNYVFDVIRNERTGGHRAKTILLVDFAPLLADNFKELAFGWAELDCDVVEFETPEFRYLEQSVQQQQNDDPSPQQFAEIQPNFEQFKYGFPIDFQDQRLSDLIPGLQDFLNKE